MKYVVVLCDGLSDNPIKELDNKTILEHAFIPNINDLAKNGMCGFIKTTPSGMSAGSDICNLSIFGYNPKVYYTGRSPLEAVSIGISLGNNDIAFRCNMVTIKDNIMESFTAHHIEDKYVSNIINALNEEFKKDNIEFYKGVGYRNLMVLRDTLVELKTTAPHDITDQNVLSYYPVGIGQDKINNIMQKARDNIFNGSINTDKATDIWLWGEGKKPKLQPFYDIYGLKGAVISAVDLIKGIGICAGMDIIDVPNITGFLDTNFQGKAEYALKALEKYDYVFVHLEAPDEAGHMGNAKIKLQAAELIDKYVVSILKEGLKKFNDYRILITPDHATPVYIKTHTAEKVPAIIYGSGITPDKNTAYSEFIEPSFDLEEGYKINKLFLNN